MGAKNLCCVPGFATPSEAFAAIEAGADGLKSLSVDEFENLSKRKTTMNKLVNSFF